MPPEWLNRLPDWRSLPVVVTSLALAAARLLVAALFPSAEVKKDDKK